MVDCGKGARDWISTAFCLKLVQRVSNGEFEYVNWAIIPLLNPDGYEFAWTSDRNWQKNRAQTANNFCVGTDLSRNYPFQWGQGGSSNPCAADYYGDSAASELETIAHIAEINSYLTEKNLSGYLTVTSFGQTVSYPFATSDLSEVSFGNIDEISDG